MARRSRARNVASHAPILFSSFVDEEIRVCVYRFLFSSYKRDYAIRDSVKCRTLIESNWYQERWGDKFQLKGDQNERTKFETEQDRLPRNHLGGDWYRRPRPDGHLRRSHQRGPGFE
jgi:hypothetical protein